MQHLSTRMATAVRAVALVAVLAIALAPAAWAKEREPGDGRGRGAKADARAAALEQVAAQLGFADLGEASWALKHVAELSVKGILQGRGKGRMAPNAPVSRAEALVMAVRLMGLDEEARRLAQAGTRFDFQFRDAARLERLAWAKPYIWLAIEKGLLANGGTLQPDKPATRVWVAELLVRALGIGQADIAAAGLTPPPFKDAKAIPADAYGYVALAVSRGLLQGYPDGTFRPNKPVTRAELAALLDRLEEQLGTDVVPALPTALRGWIKAVADGRLTVLVRSGGRLEERDLALAPNAAVFLGHDLAGAADLRPGDRADLLLGRDGTVVLVFARFAPVELRGVVESSSAQGIAVRVTAVESDWDDEIPVPAPTFSVGGTATLAVAAGARVKVAGRTVAWSAGALRPGDEVALKLHYDTVYEVRVEGGEEAEFEGVVVAKAAVEGGTELKVRVSENDDQHPVPVDGSGVATVVVPAGADVRLRGRASGIDAVAVGSRVRVKLVGAAVVRVTVEEASAEEVTGAARAEVVALATAGAEALLTLRVLGDVEGELPGRAGAGATVTARATAATRIAIAGQPATLADLRPGDQGYFRFRGDTLVAVEIPRR